MKEKFPLQLQRDIPHILPVKYAGVVVKVGGKHDLSLLFKNWSGQLGIGTVVGLALTVLS